MSFTTATITHTFLNGDMTPASGSVDFTLTGRMTNSGQTILPLKITVNLDSTGHFSQVLTANDDPGTIPSQPPVQWEVAVRVLGMSPLKAFITVPTGGGSIDLGTLLPGNEPWE